MLADWVAARSYGLDGAVHDRRIRIAYRFDAAVALPGTPWAIVYERLGTKALLLRDGTIHRELNRSFYHADHYDYPVALLHNPAGGVMVAHCPDEYCQLEFEDAETGQRLTPRSPKSVDFFHSRLTVSPDGRRVASAGWVWHPFHVVALYDVAAALSNPGVLDHADLPVECPGGDELLEATLGDDRLWVIQAEDLPTAAATLVTIDLRRNQIAATLGLARNPGQFMLCGDHLIGFDEHPRAFDLGTGKVVAEWPELQTGTRRGCIYNGPKRPALAIDPGQRRFAVGTPRGVTIISFGG